MANGDTTVYSALISGHRTIESLEHTAQEFIGKTHVDGIDHKSKGFTGVSPFQ